MRFTQIIILFLTLLVSCAVIKMPEASGNMTDTKVGLDNLAPELSIELARDTKLDLILIKPGNFLMGSDRSDQEKPVHKVTISKPFYLGKYEVTQEQWLAVMGKNPSFFPKCGMSCPVENVSWEMAQEFIKRLNAKVDGNIYRLPTEAEWEYAARAGTTGDYAGNVDEMAWYANNAGNKQIDADKILRNSNGPQTYSKRLIDNGNRTHPVGTKQANGWGLYDMSGNVLEWCQDWADRSYYGKSPQSDPKGPTIGVMRVMRGGSWGSYAANVRSAFRNLDLPSNYFGDYGFRVVAIPSISTKSVETKIRPPAPPAGPKTPTLASHTSESFNSISKTEIEMLLADVAKTNPAILKRLKEDPEMKKQQIENLKQLLAFASQAQRDGLASDPTNRQELDSIRAEILAVNYDREINKNKGSMPAFGSITEDQVKSYWGLGGTAEIRTHEAEFNNFLNAKIKILRANPDMKDREISEEEKNQARDIFAKIRIYKAEYEQKASAGELPQEFVDKANFQVKLQQAQFLARLYSEKVAEKTKVTDEDVAKYISEHPELDPAKKRIKALDILRRAKAGEDFAALANEFSEDPGNKGPDGVAKDGIYKNVPKGRMVAPFEAAALALQPGQVSPELVETDFGFHIIKLERRLTSKGSVGNNDETYDVRHILISTGYKDPDNPKAREVPVKDYVRNILEKEKEKRLLSEIVAANNIHVPDDFTVPEVSEKPIQKVTQKQQTQKQNRKKLNKKTVRRRSK